MDYDIYRSCSMNVLLYLPDAKKSCRTAHTKIEPRTKNREPRKNPLSPRLFWSIIIAATHSNDVGATHVSPAAKSSYGNNVARSEISAGAVRQCGRHVCRPYRRSSSPQCIATRAAREGPPYTLIRRRTT